MGGFTLVTNSLCAHYKNNHTKQAIAESTTDLIILRPLDAKKLKEIAFRASRLKYWVH
jgi:hypothetical protein